MEKLIGVNKTSKEQQQILKEILLKNEKMKYILQKLQKLNLKSYYIAAGFVNQTLLNYYHDFDLNYGIKDIDIVYFDIDTSYEAEDKIIKHVEKLFENDNFKMDIKNQARVHLWYENRFGSKIKPYTSVEDAISKWGSTITCIGVRLEQNELIVFAAYGLDDLFNLTVRPVKDNFEEKQYIKKTNKWKQTWPQLTIIPWD